MHWKCFLMQISQLNSYYHEKCGLSYNIPKMQLAMKIYTILHKKKKNNKHKNKNNFKINLNAIICNMHAKPII